MRTPALTRKTRPPVSLFRPLVVSSLMRRLLGMAQLGDAGRGPRPGRARSTSTAMVPLRRPSQAISRTRAPSSRPATLEREKVTTKAIAASATAAPASHMARRRLRRRPRRRAVRKRAAPTSMTSARKRPKMLGSQNSELARNGCPRAIAWATPARLTMARCVGYCTMPIRAMHGAGADEGDQQARQAGERRSRSGRARSRGRRRAGRRRRA